MRQNSFFTLLYLIIAVPLCAQTYTLTGTLAMENGESFPYKLVITEHNGALEGYSLTYQEPNEVKSSVSGTVNKAQHRLDFKEIDIIYSHEVHTNAFMCLIDARLNYVMQPIGGKVLTGTITSNETDHTSCTGGTVTFTNNADLKRLFNENYDTVITMKYHKRETPATPTTLPTEDKSVAPGIEKVTAGVDKSYQWHSDTVVVDVWDGGHIDGDMITVKCNGATYLSRYGLTATKRRIRIPLSAAAPAVITIKAENEGAEPPNTANITLIDGNIPYNILAYNNTGQEAMITIVKIKQ
jgi:hypothetical protein